MPIPIQITGLKKNFGKFFALNGVEMTVNQGEVHAFLGPNGAGKTTTIRCLLGILKASAGEIKLFGQDAWKDAVELHKRLAYVPGDVNLWDNLTGGEVIDLFFLCAEQNMTKRVESIFCNVLNLTRLKNAAPIPKEIVKK